MKVASVSNAMRSLRSQNNGLLSQVFNMAES